MIVDANMLLFAQDSSSRQHEPAKAWLTDALNGTTRIGLPWVSLLAFVRIRTHPRVFADPLTGAQAWGHVTDWLAAPAAWVPAPTERHATVLGGLIAEHGLTGNAIPDAHLATLAIEHGVAVCSADTDFARFAGATRWRDESDDRSGGSLTMLTGRSGAAAGRGVRLALPPISIGVAVRRPETRESQRSTVSASCGRRRIP